MQAGFHSADYYSPQTAYVCVCVCKMSPCFKQRSKLLGSSQPSGVYICSPLLWILNKAAPAVPLPFKINTFLHLCPFICFQLWRFTPLLFNLFEPGRTIPQHHPNQKDYKRTLESNSDVDVFHFI